MATRMNDRTVVPTGHLQRRQASLADGFSSILEPSVRALWRSFEIVTSAMALLATSPVILLLAIVVRLDSPGPALFRQIRVGRKGRQFGFYKLRTLYVDARDRWPDLYQYDYSREQIEQLQFKREEDPRITRVGRWLRKSTLDELPNFWHVITGDMALVGPRPDIPEMVAYYTEAQRRKKLSVKPGITGLAQTNGRGRLPFQKTLEYDLDYVDRKSVWLDVKILFRTVKMIVTLDGAF